MEIHYKTCSYSEQEDPESTGLRRHNVGCTSHQWSTRYDEMSQRTCLSHNLYVPEGGELDEAQSTICILVILEDQSFHLQHGMAMVINKSINQ